jgi:hypothetical protein
MLLDRRRFLQLSATPFVVAGLSRRARGAQAASITENANGVRVQGKTYSWEYSPHSDLFRLFDTRGRIVTTGSLQPAIVVSSPSDQHGACSPGRFNSKSVAGNRLAVTYDGVNQGGKTIVTWRFDEEGFWFEPVIYETTASEDVVSLHYFSRAKGETADPALQHTYLVNPGISESSALSPLLPSLNGLDLTIWLGHGSGDSAGIMQQWGLPSHYFCGLTSDPAFNAKGALKEHLSDAFCCGLSELPAGDLLFHIKNESCAPVLNLRSDLWGHIRGPGSLKLGATFYWAIGADYYQAIRQYYSGLIGAGIIRPKENSVAKNLIVTAPAFDTWGAEVAERKSWADFDESLLTSTYEGLKACGMKTKVFVIDAKWEGKYGLLEHSEERFPHFEQFLDRLRSDGMKLGVWAAFMRCDDPQALGLKTSHLLRQHDGKPITKKEGDKEYYLLDFTQAEVQQTLSDLAKRFMKRYKPDLVKFDFGYELPSLNAGAPKDMAWSGERLLKKGVEVVVGAMREVNPDLVVMYYSLSPLFIEYFDVHSPDDLFACGEDYEIAANRRFFFSSLLGELGMPTYGSGGYDWLSLPEIWFDSAVVGSLGSLATFSGDEQDSGPTPQRIAKYNGLAQLTRTTNKFTVEPLDPVLIGSVNGAHSSSWARLENGEPVLVALRNHRLGNGDRTAARYKSVVQADTSVVIASTGTEPVTRASKLGIVPYGDGEVTIQREAVSGEVTMTVHCFGKPGRKRALRAQSGPLRVPLRERLEDGALVEWLEIDFS